MSQISKQIVKKLRMILGEGHFPLHEPIFRGNEKCYVEDCLNSSYVSSVGAYVDTFEKKLADFTGASYAVTVINGTAALQISLKIAGVKQNDEVLVPGMTFIATPNAVSYLGAFPHFVDIEEKTLGLDPHALREWLLSITEYSSNYYRNKITGRRIKALVPMHTFGHPVDIEGLLSVAHDFNLELIEDAAESLGSFYKGKHTGTFGLCGAISFNGNKIITTGGGGAILTNDEKLAKYAKHITTTSKISHKWEYIHDEIGYNFRMPNLNAALGCAQIENLPKFLNSKRKLFDLYKNNLSDVDVNIFKEPKNCKSNYWLQTLVLSEYTSNQRDNILEAMNNSGLVARPPWKLINELDPYKNCPSSPLPISQNMTKRLINIPSSAGIAL